MTPGAGKRSAAPGGWRSSLDLIHRNKSPNPVFMRVSGRFDAAEGLPVQALRASCPLSFLMGWRAANAAKSES